MIVGSFLIGEGIDLFVRPSRGLRKPGFILLRALPIMIAGSIFLCLTGAVGISLLLVAVLMSVMVTASNLKMRLLNEPLVFTDFSLVGSFFKHPRFYIQGIPLFVRFLSIFVFIILIFLIILASSLDLRGRLVGMLGAIASGGLLWRLLERDSDTEARQPALWADIYNNGLLPTLLLYVVRCRKLSPLPVKEAVPKRPGAPESVIIIQCESFADPADLRKEWASLPALLQYKKEAVQWGRFLPSGLGAYTMRSEYGVLCGDDDEALSYRLFDPFLTADQSPSHALPKRLSRFYEKALFLHPYDLRFYGRNRLLPLWGFTDIIGRERFSEGERVGPYISDRALTAELLRYLQQNNHFLAYCVTIENHGPWKKGRLGQPSGADAWHKHVQNGDAMLRELVEGIKESGRDVMLVFFGDHRPALEPLPAVEGLERSTHYVILRPNAAEVTEIAGNPVDVTPAGLHKSILKHIGG
ncbi:hypothetical protein AL01_01420 [Bombella intestini]|uniref:Sulfatase N-terminal domain-containing protein n=2 Tax=Bombella intestini TaxID=1539051 RepID=A0A1S8GRI6_9PROT|nr:hypothetical protein AL01_01420 [Bombella intestini]